MFKAISLDATGTLFRVHGSVGQIYGEAARNKGWESVFNTKEECDLLTSSFKDVWIYMNNKYPNYGLGSGINSDIWWEKAVKKTFSKIEMKDIPYNSDLHHKRIKELLDEGTFKYIVKYWEDNITDCWDLLDDTVESLELFKSKNIKLAIISNFHEQLHQIISNFNIEHYFDVIATSYEYGCEKPCEEIFYKTYKNMGIINNEDNTVHIKEKFNQCIHVGDHLLKDCEGAKNVGLKAGYLRKSDDYTVINDNKIIVVTSLKDILKSCEI
eukprot:TRINITY_DN5963_c0_g1_i1.p1 TRINITY_DN5963_c0_g1~~TRINITY_DN5963_c0_g1_i1.p1  ORF type:complete len:269 (+),score=59.70 TRINITY_DN5963_c0_g1_i1:60-866(+)